MSDPISIETVYRGAYNAKIAPYPYQRALALRDDIEVLIAPTGLGKTAGVTLGWACRRLNDPRETPRRLIWCLPMRTLVEQTARETASWMCNLSGLFREKGQAAPRVHILMGGSVADDWRLHPERAAILVGTQDMLMSRALMRGYGMSRFGWAIDYGLVHADALWVFDEVQLMDAGLATSSQMEGFRRRQAWRQASAAKSLWVSATLEPEWLATVDFRPDASGTLRWNDGGEPEPANLTARLDAAKHVNKADTTLTVDHAKRPEVYARALATEVMRDHQSGRTTLIILNTVRRAQLVHEALVKGGRGPGGLLLLHSRFRPRDRKRLEERLRNEDSADRIIVATQAVEAGVDLTSAVMFTELAPWSSLVQRFGRCNRGGELNDKGGAFIRWIDIATDEVCAKPYELDALLAARARVAALANAAPRSLPPPSPPQPPRQVIRAKDFEELFDTDSDLSGFDLDISPYIRDVDETNVSLFWRDLAGAEPASAVRPRRDELCPAPLGEDLKNWLRGPSGYKSPPVFVEDPNGKRRSGWRALDTDIRLRPGMVLLLDAGMGGYVADLGFVGAASSVRVEPITESETPADDADLGERTDDDPLTTVGYKDGVPLERHLRHVETVVRKICESVELDAEAMGILARAARWHDVGKAFAPFQARLGRGADGPLLAKSSLRTSDARAQRPEGLRRYFRHELASALAFLAQHDGERGADLTAFLIASHHGKVRMGIRALPDERATPLERRIARGIQDGDELPEVNCGGEVSSAIALNLALMEMGEDDQGRPSWGARTQALLGEIGPFRLAYLEAVLRMADWRASAAERRGELEGEIDDG